MNVLDEVRSGIDQAWHSVSEGWRQFRSKAVDALTRFNPINAEKKGKSINLELEQNAMRWAVLAAELSENDKQLIVKLEAPGMEPGDFDISIVGGNLIIRGEKRAEAETSNGEYYIMECAYGSFERTIPISCQVDAAHTKASYKKGVLTLTLSKKANESRNRIPIQ